jgi:hypothetical protein
VETLFGIATKIATPLSLAALVLLILYAVYKLIFGRLQLENVVSRDVYRLTSRAMTFLFVLGLISLVLGVLSYIIVLYLNGARAEKANLLLRDLGSDSAIVRLASIHALVALMGLNKAVDTGMCDGISSFVRQRTGTGKKPSTRRLEADIQAAMGALSELVDGGHCISVDLSSSDLRGLQLAQGKLMRAKFTNSILDEANLAGADLTDAHLIGTSLVDTELRGAILKNTLLNEAIIVQTDLRSANLTGAKGLAGSNLLTALMAGAILDGVDLRQAKLPEAPINGISLRKTDLRQTDLRFLKGICKKDIAEAIIDKSTKIPESFQC